MPIYVFKCDNCGEFEILMNLNSEKPQKCPECGRAIKQQITSAQLHIRYSPMHPRHMRGQRR